MNERMNERMNEWMNGSISKDSVNQWGNEPLNQQIHEAMNLGTNEPRDG